MRFEYCNGKGNGNGNKMVRIKKIIVYFTASCFHWVLSPILRFISTTYLPRFQELCHMESCLRKEKVEMEVCGKRVMSHLKNESARKQGSEIWERYIV